MLPQGERRVRSPHGGRADLYAEPYDPKRPVVCFDETSKQLVAEKRAPYRPRRDGRSGLITSTSATGPGTCS